MIFKLMGQRFVLQKWKPCLQGKLLYKGWDIKGRWLFDTWAHAITRDTYIRMPCAKPGGLLPFPLFAGCAVQPHICNFQPPGCQGGWSHWQGSPTPCRPPLATLRLALNSSSFCTDRSVQRR